MTDDYICLSIGNELSIRSITNVFNHFSKTSYPLKYTPRKVITHPQYPLLFILEGDHHAIEIEIQNNNSIEEESENEIKEEDSQEKIDTKQIQNTTMIIEGNDGEWVGGIELFNVHQQTLIQNISFDKNCSPTSGCVVYSISKNKWYFVCGVISSYKTRPIQYSKSEIQVYEIIENKSIQFVYSTQMEYPVRSLIEYHGMILAGVGNNLRLYDIGLKSLLKKAELKKLSSDIIQLHVVHNQQQLENVFNNDNNISNQLNNLNNNHQTNEIIVSIGMSDGINLIRFNTFSRKFEIFVDSLPRWIVTCTPLSFTSYLCSDKFGEIFIFELPTETQQIALNPYSVLLQPNKYLYNASPNKLSIGMQFYTGDIATSFIPTTMTINGKPIILYSNFMGKLSALIELKHQSDKEFYQTLEMHMKLHFSNVSEREQISFRSAINPIKNVIDGDLCELFMLLDEDVQQQIANEMEKEISDIIKKLIDMRKSRLL